jgi:MFS transporter, NNP family, nitrate/nitrite transporter
MTTGFLSVGHLPTLVAAFFYFDMRFTVWFLLGPSGSANISAAAS